MVETLKLIHIPCYFTLLLFRTFGIVVIDFFEWLLNGDGYIGRRPDVVPGYPAVYGYPSLVYGPGGQIYATNGFVGHHHHSHF